MVTMAPASEKLSYIVSCDGDKRVSRVNGRCVMVMKMESHRGK